MQRATTRTRNATGRHYNFSAHHVKHESYDRPFRFRDFWRSRRGSIWRVVWVSTPPLVPLSSAMLSSQMDRIAGGPGVTEDEHLAAGLPAVQQRRAKRLDFVERYRSQLGLQPIGMVIGKLGKIGCRRIGDLHVSTVTSSNPRDRGFAPPSTAANGRRSPCCTGGSFSGHWPLSRDGATSDVRATMARPCGCCWSWSRQASCGVTRMILKTACS